MVCLCVCALIFFSLSLHNRNVSVDHTHTHTATLVLCCCCRNLFHFIHLLILFSSKTLEDAEGVCVYLIKAETITEVIRLQLRR